MEIETHWTYRDILESILVSEYQGVITYVQEDEEWEPLEE